MRRFSSIFFATRETKKKFNDTQLHSAVRLGTQPVGLGNGFGAGNAAVGLIEGSCVGGFCSSRCHPFGPSSGTSPPRPRRQSRENESATEQIRPPSRFSGKCKNPDAALLDVEIGVYVHCYQFSLEILTIFHFPLSPQTFPPLATIVLRKTVLRPIFQHLGKTVNKTSKTFPSNTPLGFRAWPKKAGEKNKEKKN